MFDYRYAYLLGTVITLLPVWLLLYKTRKDLRQEMLLLGIAGIIVAPFAEWLFTQDYWKPQFITNGNLGLESSLFVFFAVGIASTFIKTILRIHFKHDRKANSFYIGLSILAVFFMVVFGMFFGMYIFHINTIYTSMFIFLLFALIMLVDRKDLIQLSIISGFAAGLFCLTAYHIFLFFFPNIFQLWWNMNNLTKIMVIGVPLEEVVWSISFGLFIAPLYEFVYAKLIRTN